MGIRYSSCKDPAVPEITVRKSGGILLHHGTVDQFGFVGAQFADLEFDPIDRALLIKLSVDKSNAPWEVRKQRSGSLLIPAREFLIKNNLIYDEASRIFPVEWNPGGEGIIAKVDKWFSPKRGSMWSQGHDSPKHFLGHREGHSRNI
jgi:hypothetical protein